MTALAQLAAGQGSPGDPFGLIAASRMRPSSTPPDVGPTPPPPTPPSGSSGVAPVSPSPPAGPSGPTPAPTDHQHKGGHGGSGTPAPAGPIYDVNADPVLQQVYAMTQLADQNAQASALKAREDALLNYGDTALARQILGESDPLALAAGRNQESILAQLARGRDQALHGFDTNLDPSLAFSGYRLAGEGQLGQNYQDALAQAAAGIQSQLGGIGDALNSNLNSDANARAQALADAYARAVAAALATQGG